MFKTKSAYVFKIDNFRFFMEENKIDNSYTRYKNRIGLTDGKRFINDSNDIVLNFPYKDCVLEGGQSTEEGMDTSFKYSEKTKKYETEKSKRKEIFFNQIIASDEIDRLFDEKAFVNWKRYTKKGEEKVKEIKRDKDGTIKENLIIKGNNLLALHSLKKQFAGKVKLIYIDPPFNTGTNANTFKYNNNFNHSTWLTFMKNRLQIAKKLLLDDGIIAISIDHYELLYLGVLADEIFGKENRMGIIAAVHNPGGRQDDKFFPTAHENILFYAKNKDDAQLFRLGFSQDKLNQFKQEDKYGKYKLRGFRRSGNNSNKEDGPGLYYPIYYEPKRNLISLSKKNDYVKIIPIDSNGVEKCWRWGKETFINKMKKYIEVKKFKGRFEIYVKERESDYEGEKAKTIWNESNYTGQTGTGALKDLFGKKVFTYPKSPYMTRDILQITTLPNDIILDFHLGSGTTAAVAHKMGRQYIGIEQMDYVEEIICKRLKKAIEGEQSGISKSLNWQGGGDFIYFELAKWNEQAKEEIEACKNLEELKTFFITLYEKYFLNYNVKTENFKKEILKEDNFKKLSLGEQKRMFLEMLDLNQMYIQKTEMADKKFGISKEDQKSTKKFYND